MEGRVRTVRSCNPNHLGIKAYIPSLGQKAPERPEEPVDDGKTLYEVCFSTRAHRKNLWLI